MLLDALMAAERPADRHLRRQRRAHERAAAARGARSASCSTSIDRTRRRRRARAGARPPPAAAVRPAQLPARRAGRRRRLELQPRHARRRARDGGRARRAATVPGEPAAAATRAGPRARRPRRLRPPPGARVPPPAARLRRRRPTPTRSPTPSRSSSTASSRGRSASGCSTPASPAPRPTPRSRRSAPAASCRPACSPSPVIAKLLPDVEQIVKHAADLLPDATAAGLGRRPGHAPRRPPPERDRPGRARHAAAQRHLLAREPAAPADDLGAVPRADRRAPGPRVRGGDDRPRDLRRAARDDRDRRAAAEDGPGGRRSSTSPRSSTLYDDGMCEPLPLACKTSAAYAEALRDGGRRGQGGQGGVGDGWSFPREDQELEHQLRVRRRAVASTSCWRAPTSSAPRARLWDGALGWEQVAYAMTERVRRLRPAPDRRHGARGERRHRQDVHDRRAGRALRRRRRPARPAADGHVHAHGDGRAARARARAAGQRRARARARAGRRAARRTTRSCGCSPTGTPDEVGAPPRAPRAALADFDSATIATTHGFCQEVLGGLGVLGDIEPDTTFVEDVTDLREEVVDDLYVRRFAPPRHAAVRPRGGAGDRADGDRQPGRPDRAGRRARGHASPPCACGSPAPLGDELDARKRRTA